jgi:hypothetical protein
MATDKDGLWENESCEEMRNDEEGTFSFGSQFICCTKGGGRRVATINDLVDWCEETCTIEASFRLRGPPGEKWVESRQPVVAPTSPLGWH